MFQGYKRPSVYLARAAFLLFCFMFCSFSGSAQTDGSRQFVRINHIELTGNNKTFDYIIFRELKYKAGDTLTAEGFRNLLSQSRLNLLNTSLFNVVTIDTVFALKTDAIKEVDIRISLIERWYVWPIPILQLADRNFNAWWQSGDFTRVNYGLGIKWNNFTGRMDVMESMLRFGKNHQFSLAYFNPYIDQRKHLGAGIEAGYRRNRELGYLTVNDKLIYLFLADGLSTEKFFSLQATYRNDIFTTHQLVAGFRAFSFADTLAALNRDYSYPDNNHTSFIYLYYKLKIDHRDIKYYPLTGWYADIELNKSGLGFAFEKPVDVAWAKTTVRGYSQLASRWFSGVSMVGKVSTDAWQPYFLIQGLGYLRDYVRGYEYSVVDGKHYGIVRSNIKYALLPQRNDDLGFIPTTKFSRIHYAVYLTAFADAGYVWQPQWVEKNANVLPNTFLAGTGIGLDFVTYYDKVMRIEYSVNKSGKSSIFIHFIAGI